MNAQPGARLQYDHWKRWPKSHREPTQEEWARDYDRLKVAVDELYTSPAGKIIAERDALKTDVDQITDQYQLLATRVRDLELRLATADALIRRMAGEGNIRARSYMQDFSEPQKDVK